VPVGQQLCVGERLAAVCGNANSERLGIRDGDAVADGLADRHDRPRVEHSERLVDGEQRAQRERVRDWLALGAAVGNASAPNAVRLGNPDELGESNGVTERLVERLAERERLTRGLAGAEQLAERQRNPLRLPARRLVR